MSTAKRVFSLLAVNVLLFYLLTLIYAQTPSQRTVVLYVPGINTDFSGAGDNTTQIRNRWTTYAASKGISSEVVFDFSPNQHQTFVTDLAQGIVQATGFPLSTIFSDNKYNLIAMWAYSDEAIKHRVRVARSGTDSDLDALNSKIRCYLRGGSQPAGATTCSGAGTKWSGNKVVLLGHSQGSFYTNFAYEDMLNDRNFQKQLGVSLPNPNVLEVVNLANPANYSADGRYKYLTVCNDPIAFVPGSLPRNEKPGNLMCSPLVQVLQNLAVGVLAMGSTISAIATTGLTSQNLSELGSNISSILSKMGSITGGIVVDPHLLGNYLQVGSTQLQTVMQLLEDSLPDTRCAGNVDCYLEDNFSVSPYARNWDLTPIDSNSPSTLIQTAGILQLDSRGLSTDFELTLSSRRIFTGSFIADGSINHIGGGQSSVSLKRVKDNSVALALYVNNGQGQNSVTTFPSTFILLPTASDFGGWHKIEFYKSGNLVTLSVEINGLRNVWTSTASPDDLEGFYLEFDSKGFNTLLIKDISVVREPSVVGPIPIAPPSVPQTLRLEISSAPLPPPLPCTFSVQPTTQNFPNTASNGKFAVTASRSDCVWTATSNQSWVVVTSGSSFTGNGSVAYTVASNGGTSLRFASISGLFTVSQDATPPPATTGTVRFFVSGFSGNVSCLLNNISVTAPTTLTNQPVGSQSSICFPPPGFNMVSVSPTQTLVGGGVVDIYVTLAAIPVVTTGTLFCDIRDYSGTISCKLNGSNISAPFIQSGKIAGSYTLSSCVAPPNYTITVTTPTINLAVGGLSGWIINATAIPPPSPGPVLDNVRTYVTPKAGVSIDVELNGSGFVNGSQVWVCAQNSTNGYCSQPLTIYFNSGQIASPILWSNTAYIKVVNPDGKSSLFKTLQFVP